MKGMRCEAVDWIQLARIRDKWRSLVNTVMDLPAPFKVRNVLIN
jgi:hypothetical protein